MLRRLGTIDAALIVMGGILGSGIFLNPAVVAGYVRSGPLSTITWIAGGCIALAGAGVFAELAARRPQNGGFYAYLRDAFHPAVAFVYGWTLLLVAQSGGMAAGAVTFALYAAPLLHLPVPTGTLAAAIIVLFTIVNCFGVRQGALTQHTFMALNALMLLAVAGFAFFAHGHATTVAMTPVPPGQLAGAIGLALVAVLFAYDGWHTATFVSAELHEPERTLPRGIAIGVVAVVALYLLGNWAFLHGLGVAGLARSQTPATDIAALAFGPVAGGIVATLVALATTSTLSQQILVSPRVYHQMAEDGAFFRVFSYIDPRTRVPVIAILAQGTTAALVAISGTYQQILNYVESVDFVFFGLAAIALFIFRRRDGNAPVRFRLPGYPYTNAIFLVVAWAIVVNVAITSPRDTLVGLGIMLLGLPVYWLFTLNRRRLRPTVPAEFAARSRQDP